MKTITFLLISYFLFIQPTYSQVEISGITPAESIKVGDETLIFNGAGIREKYFLDLYVGSLYLTTKSQDRMKIMNKNETMAITLDIVSSLISSEKMISAIDEGFKNSTNDNIAPIEGKINTFKSFFKNEIKTGDHFVIAYQKDKGVIVTKNGKVKELIPGLAFKQALFGIWFCNRPADEDLMVGMLGKD